MSLATIVASFNSFAQAELKLVKNEGLEVLAESVEAAGGGLERIVDQTGAAATKLVVGLMNDPALSGLEKANLAATSLIEQYAVQGITIADTDATFIIKNAYHAAADYLRSLKS